MNKIIRYFPDTDLRNAHAGLALIAKKYKVDVEDLTPGEFVVFINTKHTVLKMYASSGVIAHLKMKQGHKINPKTIAMIPRYFNGSTIKYDDALREVIETDIGRME